MTTQCCIAGCGPAGAMLGLMLARQGVDTVVLEKHGDFLRDFRGDDLTPTTLEILDELGLATAFLELGPRRVSLVEAHTPDGTQLIADLSRLRTRFPYAAVIPQWDFLKFVTGEAARYPGFRLLMNAEVIGVLEESGTIRGIRYRSQDCEQEIRAQLTVAADGRSSVIRDLAGLEVVETAPPIDVLWFQLPREAGRPAETSLAIHVRHGQAMARINRGSYWVVACLIQKGGAARIQEAGIGSFQDSIRSLIPDLADDVASLRTWQQVSLLTVRTNRLRRWYRPGLLCIGDAAHAMSPIGGAGINVGIQDAVAACNRLAEPIRRGTLTVTDLAAVQREREWQIRLTQMIQDRITRAFLLAMDSRTHAPARLARWLGRRLLNLPGLTAVSSRIIGLGFRRVHVKVRAPVR